MSELTELERSGLPELVTKVLSVGKDIELAVARRYRVYPVNSDGRDETFRWGDGREAVVRPLKFTVVQQGVGDGPMNAAKEGLLKQIADTVPRGSLIIWRRRPTLYTFDQVRNTAIERGEPLDPDAPEDWWTQLSVRIGVIEEEEVA